LAHNVKDAPRSEQPSRSAIYTLSSAVDDEPRYIGKTANPRGRLNEHVRRAKRGEHPSKDSWILATAAAGHLQMKIMEWTDSWHEAEKKWIAQGFDAGWKLFNRTHGGAGTLKLRPVTDRVPLCSGDGDLTVMIKERGQGVLVATALIADNCGQPTF
jgi:hypothetical protein